MARTDPDEYARDGLAMIRNEPVQARSTKRLTTLLDSAASAVDEFGFERLTTAMVAERAGSSIGTVYRYFPDRIAVLQALSARNWDRVSAAVETAIARGGHSDWLDAVTAALDAYADAFRTEPGFRSLRLGDVIDLRPAPAIEPGSSRLAALILDAIIGRFGGTATDEARAAFDSAVSAADAVIARAFARSNAGDPVFLEQSRQLVREYLAARFSTN